MVCKLSITKGSFAKVSFILSHPLVYVLSLGLVSLILFYSFNNTTSLHKYASIACLLDVSRKMTTDAQCS